MVDIRALDFRLLKVKELNSSYKLFAIVDIETTGGSAANSRITEIAVIIHDGLSVVEKFSTLINPEVTIPYHISRLTGITDQMVADAPKFYEMAKKLIELMKGKIFIAHNVGFDYGFIKQEYKNLGYDFKMEKLCTVQLSRKLLPGKSSYSLGKLCDELNINNNARHRTEGDALATTKLFELLLKAKNEHPQYKTFGIEQLTRKISFKTSNILIDKLPEETGVYYFYDAKGTIIYIGKSKNIKQRALSHFRNSSSKKGVNLMNSIVDVDYKVTGNELIALLLESHEIKTHKPIFNHAKRRSAFSHGIELFYDMQGYENLKLIKNVEGTIPVLSFTTQEGAKQYLYDLLREYSLCQKLTGLYHSDGACFGFQVKACHGACIQQEPADLYNKRVQKAIVASGLGNRSFFIVDSGRNAEESSFVQVEDGKYIGFGYIDNSENISDPQALKSYITTYPDNRDARQVIKNYLGEKKRRLIPYTGK